MAQKKRAAPPRAPLSRERILQSALAIVDAEGLEAISMRRLGESLGVEAMSLYNHVANKAAVLDGLFELVLSELPPPPVGLAWQATLRRRALDLRAVLALHPRVLPLFATRPAVTPGAIAHVESVLACLEEAGFAPDDALSALQLLMALVVGHTLATCAWPAPVEAGTPRYELLSAAEFPRVRAVAALLATHDPDQELALGLDALLLGLASHPGPRSAPAAPKPRRLR